MWPARHAHTGTWNDRVGGMLVMTRLPLVVCMREIMTREGQGYPQSHSNKQIADLLTPRQGEPTHPSSVGPLHSCPAAKLKQQQGICEHACIPRPQPQSTRAFSSQRSLLRHRLRGCPQVHGWWASYEVGSILISLQVSPDLKFYHWRVFLWG